MLIRRHRNIKPAVKEEPKKKAGRPKGSKGKKTRPIAESENGANQ